MVSILLFVEIYLLFFKNRRTIRKEKYVKADQHPNLTAKREASKYDWVGESVVSFDGTKKAFKARKGDKWLIVMDGKEGKEYDNVSDPKFSRENSRMWYTARGGEHQLLIIDGQESKEYDEIDPPTFNKDNSRYFFKGRKANK